MGVQHSKANDSYSSDTQTVEQATNTYQELQQIGTAGTETECY